jgi:hypothetical protein
MIDNIGDIAKSINYNSEEYKGSYDEFAKDFREKGLIYKLLYNVLAVQWGSAILASSGFAYRFI